MHPDMLFLAERLVIAMEAMSQDVKNMTAYVYDISCSVSYLLNENRGKESASVVAHDEREVPSSVTSKQHEQADERSSSYIGGLEHGEITWRDIEPTSIDPHENLDVLSSESNSFLSGGIKMEEPAEVDMNDESSDVTILKEIKSETQSEAESDYQSYALHTAVSHSAGQLTPAESIPRTEFTSNLVLHDIQSVETSYNSAIRGDHTKFVSRSPEGQASLDRTCRIESAKDSLLGHARVQFEEKSYKCLFCGKLFSTQGDLQSHSRAHTGERPFKCNICERAFSRSAHLTIHMRCHTGERPYKCYMCGKAFSQKNNLIVHMRSHTGETPYKCNVCGKAFRHSTVRNQHMGMHSIEQRN